MSNGQLQQTDFFSNVGGTNLSDSVFRIQDGQAAGGFNFDYSLTGGIKKRLGPALINSMADTQLRTLGFGLYAPATGAKSVIRAAGTELQLFDTSVPSFTPLTKDNTIAGSNPFVDGSTETVNFSQFNNGSSDILWAVGGGATLPIGVVSTTQFTELGVQDPAGSIGLTVNPHGGGTWAAAGAYTYSIVYRKRSTQAQSNATLDATATIVNTDDTVTIDLTTLTGLDTTLIDQIIIYRSDLNGGEGFTTGSIIAELASTATSYIDDGSSISDSENVPRSANTTLDNSPLPSGTYNTITVWKRRLVVSKGNQLYISDLNKSESYPLTNYLTVPSAGPILALAVISFTSPQANALDEILVIFKEREMWVLTGIDFNDWALKFIDQTGCPQQSLVVVANGFLSWIDFRGVYLWDGGSKPTYCSRMIEPLFARDGDLNKVNFPFGCGEFFRKSNEIIWYLSSKTYGEQMFAIKLDVRLTMPNIEQNLTGRTLDAIFIQDTYQIPFYSAMSYIPSGGSDEVMVLGDNAGFCYFAASGYGDGIDDFSFTYKTKPLEMGDPNTEKLFHKVIVWVDNVGNWELTLDYWSNYKTNNRYKTTKALPLSTEDFGLAALWDVAIWDVSFWDDFTSNVSPMVFNLEPGVANSNQGQALQLQFRNDTQLQPITIHGFSVIWSQTGGLTA